MLYRRETEELQTLIHAGYPLIYIVTADERPVLQALKTILHERLEEEAYSLRTWDRYEHLYNETEGCRIVVKSEASDEPEIPYDNPLQVLRNMRGRQGNTITVFHDLHHLLEAKRDQDRELVRALKNFTLTMTLPFTVDYSLEKYKQLNDPYKKHVIITSPVLKIPKELEKVAYVVEFSLPGKEEIQDILTSYEAAQGMKFIGKERSEAVKALLGLTETEIFHALKKSMIKNNGKLIAKEIFQDKKQILKKSKLIEYVDTDVSANGLGGMKHLLDWIKKRKKVFSDSFRCTYALEHPKGLLLTGVPGCGKSYAVQVIANELNLPLLRMDMGTLLGSYLGESEQNLREAIALAEAVSPCILWIDEIEKAMPSNRSDGHETVQRMFGKILTWLQEKESPVFVVATANNIARLPPELLRKGRFDEIFFVDLPSLEEREEIVQIHLRKRNIRLPIRTVKQISAGCDGFSGAEIEVGIKEAILEAGMNGQKVSAKHILEEFQSTTPISVTMHEQISEIQAWAAKQNVRRVSKCWERQINQFGFH